MSGIWHAPDTETGRELVKFIRRGYHIAALAAGVIAFDHAIPRHHSTLDVLVAGTWAVVGATCIYRAQSVRVSR